MSKSIALGLLCAGALLLAALLTGCSDAPSPTPSAGAVPTSTGTAQPGVTPVPPPTPTMAPTRTSTPGPTPEPATFSLNVYLTLCAPRDLGLADDLTYGDFSSELAAEADRFEALTPPAQLSEWHLLNIEAYRTTQALVDIQPKDDVVDFNSSFLIAVGDDFGEKLSEAAARVPKDVRQPMIEAGCIDPEDVPDDYGNDIDDATVAPTHTPTPVPTPAPTTVVDDHGDDIDDATVAAMGTDVEGAIDYLGDSDYFRFIAEEGQIYQIDVALGTLDDSMVYLHDTDGSFLGSSEDRGGPFAEGLYWEAPSNGERYVNVTGVFGIGSYTLTVSLADPIDDHGNSGGRATRIAIGEAVAIELEDIDDIDVLVFRARPGTEYVLTLNWESYSFRQSYTARPIVALFDADGQEHTRLMGYNYYENGVQSIDLMWQAVTGGDYYIVVGDGNTHGSLTLTVTDGEETEQLDRDDHGNDIDDATAIRVGADVRGALDYDGDIDYLRFQAEQGESYQIDVALGTLDDSMVYLYDADGSFLDTNDDYVGTSASRLYWEAPSNGVYYVAVTGFYGIGTYTLTVSIIDDRGNGFESATRIAIGEAVAIELEDLDEEDVLVFLAEPGRDYVITLDWETYQVWDNPGSIMALYDASGQELARLNNYDFSSNRSRNKIMWRAVTGGDYYILVGDENTLGTFTLTVTGGEETEQLDRDDHGNDIDDATVAALGVDVEGVIDYEGDSDYFRFTAEEGRLYQIDVTLGTLPDSYLTLYVEMVGPETWRVEPNDDYGDSQGSRVVWEATESGDYYIRVNGGARSDQVGSYTLTVSVSDDDHGGSASDASAVTVGESIEGAVNYLGDEDVFLFQVEAGAIYEIEVTLGTLADSDLVVYDEPDEWKGRSYSPVLSVKTHRNVWRSEYTGDSYLVVGFPGNESGSYTVRVARITLTGNTSYDTDGDGLIEVANLEQLDAIRWDLDGDGLPDSSSGMAGFATAFPGALDGMGCPDSECSGYELISDLDFDTNGNGRADAGDDYWNDGEGWAPIGDDFGAAFESFFDGGGYTISNLYIDRRDAKYVGLFGNTGHSGSNYFVGLNNNIRDLALVNVDVQGGTYTGGLVGSNGLVIAACSVTGVVRGSLRVGGLVGSNFSGTIIASYSAASVADGTDTGGLVGSNFSGTIIASYSIGSVSDYNGASSFADVGGLVGSNFADRGTTRDSYWDTQTSGQSASAGGEGRTTSELQSPTGYMGIYENWNLDLDDDGVGDDLWDFGNASQYPTLRHGS